MPEVDVYVSDETLTLSRRWNNPVVPPVRSVVEQAVQPAVRPLIRARPAPDAMVGACVLGQYLILQVLQGLRVVPDVCGLTGTPLLGKLGGNCDTRGTRVRGQGNPLPGLPVTYAEVLQSPGDVNEREQRVEVHGLP